MSFRKFFESAQQEAAFWEEIVDDDTATSRMVYADWLEDNPHSPNHRFVALVRGAQPFVVSVTTYTINVDDDDGELIIDEVIDTGAATWDQLVAMIRYPKNDDDFVYCTRLRPRPYADGEYPHIRLGDINSPECWVQLNTGDYPHEDGEVYLRRRLEIFIRNRESPPAWIMHCLLRQAGWYTT